MTRRNRRNNERADSMYVKEETEPEDILRYVRKRSTDPKEVGGKLVWNFSSYEIDESGLNLEFKEQDEFVIPYQVGGTWAMMYGFLPERIKNAELLVWRTDVNEYYAYKNFYRMVPQEQREEFKAAVSKELSDRDYYG